MPRAATHQQPETPPVATGRMTSKAIAARSSGDDHLREMFADVANRMMDEEDGA